LIAKSGVRLTHTTHDSSLSLIQKSLGIFLFDVAIIGAGINGSCMAHELTREGKRVAIFDMNGVAGGGSGAAGAFISPKFTRKGELQELLEKAFVYSMAFYTKNTPHLLHKAQLLHLAKDAKDAENIALFKEQTSLRLLDKSENLLEKLTPEARMMESVCIEGGIVDAAATCHALAKSATFYKQKVTSLYFDDGMWILNDTYSAKHVVLATGAYEPLLDEPYKEVRGIWGHRIDVATSTCHDFSLHQFVSIAPSREGVVAIGATHNVHYHPQKNSEPYDFEAGRVELLEKASRTLDLKDVTILKDYVGLRSGSTDYLPLLGDVVIAKETLKLSARELMVKKPDSKSFTYYPNLSMINGNGGYGFVLAPYLAKIVTSNILHAKEIPLRMQSARSFVRWAKKKES
jgi:tRNA 5-methylaminomethyl-2-thiouridine biosynthesis bifunctional protein